MDKRGEAVLAAVAAALVAAGYRPGGARGTRGTQCLTTPAGPRPAGEGRPAWVLFGRHTALRGAQHVDERRRGRLW